MLHVVLLIGIVSVVRVAHIIQCNSLNIAPNINGKFRKSAKLLAKVRTL